MPELFGIPQYRIKRAWLGELHPTTTEKYLSNFMKGRFDAVAIELGLSGNVVVHEEHVVSSVEV